MNIKLHIDNILKHPLGELLVDGSPHCHLQFIDFEVEDALTQIIIFRHT